MSFLWMAQAACETCVGTQDKLIRLASKKMIFDETDEAGGEANTWYKEGDITDEDCRYIKAMVLEVRRACTSCDGQKAAVSELIKNNEVLQGITDRMTEVMGEVDRVAAKTAAKRKANNHGKLAVLQFGKKPTGKDTGENSA